MNIDPQFLDVDFSAQPQFVRGDNGSRPFRSALRVYEAEVPQVPESEWPAEAEKLEAGGGLEWLVTRIMNQGNFGSCVGHAGTQQHQIIQAKVFGIDKVVQLSPVSLYQLIGRSANSGANINDALDEGTDKGIIPLDSPENRATFGTVVMPSADFYARRPIGWEAVAQRFRFDESFVVETVGGMMSALFNGHPIVVGRAGHSICYVRPTYDNGKLNVMYVNSWSPEWGQAAGKHPGGFGFDSMNLIRQSAQWCYALRSIINPGT